MVFVWKGFGLGGRAHDRQNGITISAVHRFEDLDPGDAFPYRYVQGDLDFEFRAISYNLKSPSFCSRS